MADDTTDGSEQRPSHLDDAGGGCAELWEQAFEIRNDDTDGTDIDNGD